MEKENKNFFVKVLDNVNQRHHPFGLAEKRFEWKQNYNNGNDLRVSKIRRLHLDENKNNIICNKYYNSRRQNDHFKGGLGKFLNTMEIKNRKENIDMNSDYSRIKQRLKYDCNKYNRTLRVIFPDKNYEGPQKKTKKKFFGDKEKKLRNTSAGSYASLMDRTPITMPIRGRKRLNKSIDYGNNNSNNREEDKYDFFWKGRRNSIECTNDRLFGVERKKKLKVINLETEPSYLRQCGRKHFKVEDKVG